MKMAEYRIGFMGFGHMSQVIFDSFNRAKLVPRSHVLFHRRDRAKAKENEQTFKISSTSLENLVQKSDVIILGVRPQQADLAMKELQNLGALEGKWLISMLPGKQIAYFQKHLGNEIQILRIMPNLPASVGEGMTILTYGANCNSDFRTFGSLFFGSMGMIAEVPEALMDIACAMSGCSPGFVLRLIEASARTGEKHGIPYKQGLMIAAQTFAGTACLILRGLMPFDLIRDIATPQGVTEAGFEIMTKWEIDKHFQEVIEASMRKARDLSLDA